MRPQNSDRKCNERAYVSFLGITLLVFSMLVSIAGAAPFVYIPNTGDNTVSIIDTATDTVYETISGFDAAYIGVAVGPDGKTVYVTNFNSSESVNNVSVINTTENKITANLQLGFEPYAIAVSPGGKEIYVTNSNDGKLSVINVTDPDNFDVNNIELGGYPTGVVVSPDGTRVYVANYYYSDGQLKGNVSVINTKDDSVTSTLEVGQMLFGIAISPDGKKVYVTSMDPISGLNGNVSVINTTDNNVAHIEVGVSPGGIAVSPDGTRVYVVNTNISWNPTGNSNVSIIDTTADQYSVIANVSVGWGALGVSVTPDGKKVYVPNSLNNTVSVIDTESNNVIATVPLGVTPMAFGQFIGPDLSAQPTIPVANFTENETSGLLPLAVKFDASTSQYADSYSWNFGDGSGLGNGQIVEHTFVNPGTFNVNLTVTNNNGTNTTGPHVIEVTSPYLPALTISKTAHPHKYRSVGEKITYIYNVTNTGNVPVSNISVTDNKTKVKISKGTLASGKNFVGTATYCITQNDIDNGSVINSAYARGNYSSTQTVTSNTVTATSTAMQRPALTITEIAIPANYNTLKKIKYIFTVKNSGNVQVENIVFNDTKSNYGNITIGTLAPGKSASGTDTYTITNADLISKSVTNTATAIGTFNGKTVSSKQVKITLKYKRGRF